MIKSQAQRVIAYIVISVLLTVTESSHQYASLEEIRCLPRGIPLFFYSIMV